MSGIDDPDTPPEVPEEYAAVYRDAYRRALESESGPESGLETGSETGPGFAPESNEAPGWLTPALIVGAVLLVVLGVLAVVQMSGDDGAPSAGPDRTAVTTSPGSPKPSHPAPTSTGDDEPETDPALGPDWDGAVAPVAIDEVDASCTSDPGVDSAGRKVVYDADRATDGDASTAWRCDGRAVGETLTFDLGEDTEIGEVGLIPGYAKTDPRSGDDRYAENNRITRVRWTLADGVVIEQDLDGSPKNRELQTIRVPRTATGSITLEILDVVEGSRNTTAISEVVVSEAR